MSPVSYLQSIHRRLGLTDFCDRVREREAEEHTPGKKKEKYLPHVVGL